MDFLANYYEYLNAFDGFILAFGGFFILAQIIFKLNLKQKENKEKFKSSSTIEKSQIIEKLEKNKITWFKGAGMIREMIALLPFLGILGTVIGLLNTLHNFSLRSGTGIESVMADFAPALTSTISALILTIINMVIFNLSLYPHLVEDEEISKKPIFSSRLKQTTEKKSSKDNTNTNNL
ncbi:MAG: MotA/TolQ/ExbB proton channel family protein [Spirochaetota bacterium]